jgi:hemoglobin
MSDQATAPPVTTSPYDQVGGESGVRRIVDRFYEIMDTDPAAADIRAMHGADLAPMRQRLFEFMSGWLGGPGLYRGCVVGAHRGFTIGVAERDQWLSCMARALDDAEIAPEVREMLAKPLFAVAEFMRNG